jgi:hypothetical protein
MRGSSVSGMSLPGFTVDVHREAVVRFCDAIGERRGEYRDPATARAAGYRDVLVPPTYLFSLELHRPQPYLAVEMLGARVCDVRHAEQSFDYGVPCCAGDRLRFELVVSDYYEKRGGRLGFLERRATVTRGDGALVGVLVNLLAIRWPVAS